MELLCLIFLLLWGKRGDDISGKRLEFDVLHRLRRSIIRIIYRLRRQLCWSRRVWFE